MEELKELSRSRLLGRRDSSPTHRQEQPDQTDTSATDKFEHSSQTCEKKFREEAQGAI